jgi:hypothetical protein
MIDFVPPEETPAREYPSVRARAQPSPAEPSRVWLPARAVLRSAPAAPMRRRRGTAADDRMALRNTEQQIAPKSIPPRPKRCHRQQTNKQTTSLRDRLGTDGAVGRERPGWRRREHPRVPPEGGRSGCVAPPIVSLELWNASKTVTGGSTDRALRRRPPAQPMRPPAHTAAAVRSSERVGERHIHSRARDRQAGTYRCVCVCVRVCERSGRARV